MALKESMFKIPIIGRIMKKAGYIGVKRGDKESGSIALKECAEWMKKGYSVFIFPEGTFSAEKEFDHLKLARLNLHMN